MILFDFGKLWSRASTFCFVWNLDEHKWIRNLKVLEIWPESLGRRGVHKSLSHELNVHCKFFCFCIPFLYRFYIDVVLLITYSIQKAMFSPQSFIKWGLTLGLEWVSCNVLAFDWDWAFVLLHWQSLIHACTWSNEIFDQPTIVDLPFNLKY